MEKQHTDVPVLEKGKDFKPGLSFKVRLVRLIGNLLILAGVVGLFFTFWPLITTEIPYRIAKWRGQSFSVDAPKISGFGQILKNQENLIIPKSVGFGLVVEKINANSEVIANVNPANEREYRKALEKGVAHAKGTAFPGQPGMSFLFAHSTLNPWDVPRYNAVFYLLRELEAGDRIVTYFDGKRYDYEVYDKKVVGAKDVQFLKMKTEEPILILQTCDPPGTTWKRLLVFAKMKQS